MRKKFCYVGLVTLIILSNLLVGFAEETYTWEEKASMNVPRDRHCLVVAENELYAIGGNDQSLGTLNANEKYNPTTNTWQTKASMITKRKYFDAVYYKEKIYVFGGTTGRSQDEDITNKVEVYDISSNTWSQLPDMPHSRRHLGAKIVNDKVYILGGYDGQSFIEAIDVFDLKTSTWDTISNMPVPRLYSSIEVLDNKIFFIGGIVLEDNQQKQVKRVDVYNVLSNTWSIAEDMINVIGFPKSLVLNNKIYVFERTSDTVLINIYKPSTGEWSKVENVFDKHRNSYATAALNNKMYISGGRESGTSSLAKLFAITVVNNAPINPTNLTATSGNSQVTLNWTAVDGAESYNVKRSTTQGGPYTTIADNVTSTSYIDTNVTNGTTYYYVVTAVNVDGESENSNEASATPFAPIVNRALLNITMQNGLIKEYDMAMSEVESFISWYNRSNGSKLYTINKYDNIGPFLNRKDYLVKDKILCFEVMEYENNN